MAVALAAWFAGTGTAPGAEPGPGRKAVVILVDDAVADGIRPGLERYVREVEAEFDVDLEVLSGPFAAATPREIRSRLRERYEDSGRALTGAILVGSIPVPIRAGGSVRVPAPFYYEDFDAEWIDADGDGAFDELRTDRTSNPTEIWTSWWVPPADDPAEQIDLLNGYLDKLHRWRAGDLVGRDGFLFIASPINSTEITESWTVLLKGVLASVGQRLELWSRRAEDPGAVHPDPGPEFGAEDFVGLLTSRRWQHAHIITHGSPSGFYWDGQSVTTGNLDFSRFHGTGANLVTTSGCSNGNFRGRLGAEADPALGIGNRMLFSPDTVTVAWFGSASPQSTGIFAMYVNSLIESVMPEARSYLAEGYYRMRNGDHAWGIDHYFFRGGDEKILTGDPFFRYRGGGADAAKSDAADAAKSDAADADGSEAGPSIPAESACPVD